jgi:membrane protein YdbS with pleckstrin-like domain
MKGHSGSSVIHTLYLHIGSFMKNIYMNESLFAIFALILLIQFGFFKNEKKSDFDFIKLFVFPITIGILHHLFAQVNWLYRYENYTLFIAGLCLFPLLRFLLNNLNLKSTKDSLVVATVAILFIMPLLHRNAYTFKIHKNAQSDIYYQHISIADYVSYSNLFDKSPLGINDIGAIAYYADPKLLDIWGLANYELTKFKHLQASEYMPGIIDSLKPEYAIYYKEIFSEYFEGWVDVAVWDSGKTTVAASQRVYFSAVDSSRARLLYSDLIKYRNNFPDKVNFDVIFRPQ